MTETNCSDRISRPRLALLVLASALPLASSSAQTPTGQGPTYSVVDQGAFYRVWQSAGPVTNAATGQVSQPLASYTELGDGLC